MFFSLFSLPSIAAMNPFWRTCAWSIEPPEEVRCCVAAVCVFFFWLRCILTRSGERTEGYPLGLSVGWKHKAGKQKKKRPTQQKAKSPSKYGRSRLQIRNKRTKHAPKRTHTIFLADPLSVSEPGPKHRRGQGPISFFRLQQSVKKFCIYLSLPSTLTARSGLPGRLLPDRLTD